MKKSKKDLYSLKEIYKITYNAFFTVDKLIKSRKDNLLDKQFVERIMLAVTQVNACPACTYGHTKIALETGMTNKEIQDILSGTLENIPIQQLGAVMFAQHYADTNGHPTSKSWDKIKEMYGTETAEAILASIRMIMLGNTYGIAWGSLIGRLKGKPDSRCNLLYELSVVVASVIFIPVAIVHAALARLVDTSIIDFM